MTRDLDTKAPPLLGGVFALKIKTVLESSEFLDIKFVSGFSKIIDVERIQGEQAFRLRKSLY